MLENTSVQGKNQERSFLLEVEKKSWVRVFVLFVAYSTSFKYIEYITKQCANESSFVIFLVLGLEDTAFYLKVIDI